MPSNICLSGLTEIAIVHAVPGWLMPQAQFKLLLLLLSSSLLLLQINIISDIS